MPNFAYVCDDADCSATLHTSIAGEESAATKAEAEAAGWQRTDDHVWCPEHKEQ